jgi:hypothetical protein
VAIGWKVNALFLNAVLMLSPKYLLTLNPNDALLLLRQLNFETLRDGWRAKLHGEKEEYYYTTGLNSWGDETIDYRQRQDFAGWQNRLNKSLEKYRSQELLPQRFHPARVEWSSFVAWAHARSISVFGTWPNAIEAPPFEGPQFTFTQNSLAKFYHDLGIKMVGKREDAVIPASLMLDTVYHPTLSGARLRSARLAESLCAELRRCPHEQHAEK